MADKSDDDEGIVPGLGQFFVILGIGWLGYALARTCEERVLWVPLWGPLWKKG